MNDDDWYKVLKNEKLYVLRWMHLVPPMALSDTARLNVNYFVMTCTFVRYIQSIL